MRLSPIDPDVLNVFLLDPEDEEQIDAVRDAISESSPGAIPPGGIQAVQGQYRILDLYQWHNEVVAAISKSDWARDGMFFSDIQEGSNRAEIGVVSEEYVKNVNAILATMGHIPHAAVAVAASPGLKMLPLR